MEAQHRPWTAPWTLPLPRAAVSLAQPWLWPAPVQEASRDRISVSVLFTNKALKV